MVVKIRFGRGPVVSRRTGKNRRIARLASSFLTLISLSGASLGAWRIAADLGWAGDFVFATGIQSHWQVWIAAAAAIQYTAWRLLQYANAAAPEAPRPATGEQSTPERMKAAANV